MSGPGPDAMAKEQPVERQQVRTITQRYRRKGHGMPFYVLVFFTAVLVLNAVFGERGLLAMIRANRNHAQLQEELARAQAENARLSEEARLVDEDPATIEDIARSELGLIKPGEKVFIIRDLPPLSNVPKASPSGAPAANAPSPVPGAPTTKDQQPAAPAPEPRPKHPSTN